uniref:Uncharacterized protein n=1 Tax=Rhizophora mucronata TaxID=61149 RepID=A0A2P2M9M3_RHIMU
MVDEFLCPIIVSILFL